MGDVLEEEQKVCPSLLPLAPGAVLGDLFRQHQGLAQRVWVINTNFLAPEDRTLCGMPFLLLLTFCRDEEVSELENWLC